MTPSSLGGCVCVRELGLSMFKIVCTFQLRSTSDGFLTYMTECLNFVN